MTSLAALRLGCLVCGKIAVGRGLCGTHLKKIHDRIKAGELTEAQAIKRRLIRPSKLLAHRLAYGREFHKLMTAGRKAG